MTIQDIFSKARLTLTDTKRATYPDEELKGYLSDAIEYLSAILAGMCSSYTRKAVWATVSPMTLPKDFLTADTNEKDARYFEDYIEFDKLPRRFAYYRKYKLPAKTNEDILIPSEFFSALTGNVVNRALIRNEYSTSSEQQINDRFFTMISEIAKRRDGIIRHAERELKYEL